MLCLWKCLQKVYVSDVLMHFRKKRKLWRRFDCVNKWLLSWNFDNSHSHFHYIIFTHVKLCFMSCLYICNRTCRDTQVAATCTLWKPRIVCQICSILSLISSSPSWCQWCCCISFIEHLIWLTLYFYLVSIKLKLFTNCIFLPRNLVIAGITTTPMAWATNF